MSDRAPSPGRPAEELSTGELFERLNTQVTTLIRTEIASAAAEMKGAGARIGIGVGVSGVGLMLAFFGVGALVAAAILGVATTLPGWSAALIIGAAFIAGGAVIAGIGAVRARTAAPPMPQKTAESLRADANAVKEQL